jgi:hypothetical protein
LFNKEEELIMAQDKDISLKTSPTIEDRLAKLEAFKNDCLDRMGIKRVETPQDDKWEPL